MELREAIEEIRNPSLNASNRMTAYEVCLNAIIDGTLIPADQCYEVREGYEAYALEKRGRGYRIADLTEALTIRSADDVRREDWLEVRDCVCKMNWPVDDADEILDAIKSALIDTPQPKGGDDV